MEKLHISYKVSTVNYISLIVLLTLISPLFAFGLTSGDPIIGKSIVITQLTFGSILLISIVAIIYSSYILKVNYKRTISLTVEDGTLSFYPGHYDQNRVFLKLDKIRNSSVNNAPRSGVKYVTFFEGTNEYQIGDMDFTEVEFAKICNILVKTSDRCKACQSKQVAWSGDKGHCYNCETITPKNSDEFDWKQAYQA